MNYTQKFFLCALNQKGNLSTLKFQHIYSLLTISGILELIHGGFLIRDEKDRLLASQPLEGNLPYLKSLYETIISFKKPKKLKDVVLNYGYGSGKKINAFVEDIGTSLVNENVVLLENKDEFFGNKMKYIPVHSATLDVMKNVRIDILEKKELTNDMIILLILLEKSGIIKEYFNKNESQKLKETLKLLRQSHTHKDIKKTIDYIDAIWITTVMMTTSTTN